MTDYIIIAIAAISIFLNVFFTWYVRGLLTRLYYVTNNLSDLVEETVSFKDHLESVHELETFYGDETLTGLISHTRTYCDTLLDFEEIYTLLDEEDLEETDVDDEETIDAGTDYPEIEAREEKEKKANQANVFYAGSRRRDS